MTAPAHELYDSSFRAWLRSPAADREIAARGRRLWPLPTANLDLIPTMAIIRDEVDVSSRIVELDGLPREKPGWIPLLIASTALARDDLAQARPIIVDRRLAEALPDWPSRADLLAAITGMRLPFTTVLVTLRDERDWLPIGTEMRPQDGTRPIVARWAACLLRQPADGELLAIPFAALHGERPRELSCPTAIWFTRRRPDHVPLGTVCVVIGTSGITDVVSWAEPADQEQAYGLMQLAMAIVDRAAAAIELCNSINIVVVPLELRGKALKLARRKQRLVPYIVQIRKQVRRMANDEYGEPPLYSHRFDVRGHFAYYKRGALFDANPERRRYIPQLGCEAVPVWRRPHLKGPEGAPYRPKVWLLGRHVSERWLQGSPEATTARAG